jgi:hypothetical protein
MSLEKMMATFESVAYAPRTLDLNLPPDLTSNLSSHGRAFFDIAYGKTNISTLEMANGKWKDDPLALEFFFDGSDDDRLEILALLTLVVHEFTHRVDFLISPYGLHYYTNTLREYWLLQKFVPIILDDPQTVDRMKFLAGFGENSPLQSENYKELWKSLEQMIHVFYAWGDASGVKPLGKYIKEGWDDGGLLPGDYFGVGVDLERITVLNLFPTLRIPGGDRLWYLRPLTIFETKALVNSFLFIGYVLGDRAGPAFLDYYERLYLERKDQLPKDYFFLLDMGAGLYGLPDFHTLLQQDRPEMIRSTLLMLSSICWFALQAPPPLRDEDPCVANPILRLILAFRFFAAFSRGQLNVSFRSTAEGLLILDDAKSPAFAKCVKPIRDIIPACVKIVDYMLEQNEKQTWNPEVKKHFHHVFTLMRPHFSEREHTYVSPLGMPDNGSPFLEGRTNEDWELFYEDYEVSADVKDWFSIRTDLFFNLLKPVPEVIKRLDNHFLAFLFPYICEECGVVTPQWHSRFAEQYHLTCANCHTTKTVSRDDVVGIEMNPEK